MRSPAGSEGCGQGGGGEAGASVCTACGEAELSQPSLGSLRCSQGPALAPCSAAGREKTTLLQCSTGICSPSPPISHFSDASNAAMP